jgi:hypothetical protein
MTTQPAITTPLANVKKRPPPEQVVQIGKRKLLNPLLIPLRDGTTLNTEADNHPRPPSVEIGNYLVLFEYAARACVVDAEKSSENELEDLCLFFETLDFCCVQVKRTDPKWNYVVEASVLPVYCIQAEELVGNLSSFLFDFEPTKNDTTMILPDRDFTKSGVEWSDESLLDTEIDETMIATNKIRDMIEQLDVDMDDDMGILDQTRKAARVCLGVNTNAYNTHLFTGALLAHYIRRFMK